jgi:two-component system cell cycle sensor histidine kinase/response regulator CckA
MQHLLVALSVILECAAIAGIARTLRARAESRTRILCAAVLALSVAGTIACIYLTYHLPVYIDAVAGLGALTAMLGAIFSFSLRLPAPQGHESTSDFDMRPDDLKQLTDSSIRRISQTAPVYITLHERDTRIAFISRTRSGRPPEELIGTPLSDYVVPEYRDRFIEAYERVWDTREAVEIEYLSNDPKEGRRVWFHSYLAPILRNGKTSKIVSFSLEVDARKRYEEAMKSIVGGTAGKSGGAYFDSLVESLSRALCIRYAFVGELIAPNRTRVRSLALVDEGKMLANIEYDLEKTPCATAISQNFCKFARNLAGSFPEDELLVSMQIESYMGMRLQNSQGEPVGILVCMHDAPKDWLPEEESIFAMFAARAGAELERAHAEDELRRAKNYVQRVADASPYTIFVFNVIERRLIYVSPRIEKDLGVSATDLVERGPLLLVELMHPGEYAVLGELLGRWVGKDDHHVQESQYRLRRATGEYGWFQTLATVFDRTPDGQVREIIGTVQDITDRKRMEDALRESEREKTAMLGNLPGMAYRCRNEPSWPMTFVSQGAVELTGYTPEEFESGSFGYNELIVAEDQAQVWECVQAALAVREPYRLTYRIVDRAGNRKWVWEQGVGVFDSEGTLLFLEGFVADITDRKLGEEAVVESERRFRQLFEQAADAFYVHDETGRFVDANDNACKALGYTYNELAGLNVLDVDVPSREYDVFAMWNELSQTPGLPRTFESVHQRKDGSRFPVEVRVGVLEMRGRSLFLAIVRDISDRKNAEDALRLSEERFKSAVVNSPIGLAIVSLDGRFIEVNDALCRIVGYTPEELVTKTFQDITHPDDLEDSLLRGALLARGDVPAYQLEKRYVRKDGSSVWIQANVSFVRDADGNPVHIVGQIQDISQRRAAERALRESEERFELALSGADLGSWDWNLETGDIHTNSRWAEMLGYTLDTLTPNIASWGALIHPDDTKRVGNTFAAHLKGETQTYDCEYRVRSSSGQWVWILDRGQVVERNAAGRAVRAAGTHLDITERKRAEVERLQLEGQIQHAQKLESLGVLAGGIAHDFNNLLVAILGNADLALNDLEISSPARHSVQEIEVASRRAAELCRQMLAYAGKGRFEVQALDLREVVEEMAKMLEVSISKKISLKYTFTHPVPPIEADAAQIRQVIMNLIINASEAIGESVGAIAIRVGGGHYEHGYLNGTYLNEELPEGNYAYFEVSDTGCGMSEETKRKLFEPFFTTKFTGRGLGMAAVLGIVRGHRGAIKVYSELGKGTTFKVLLPASTKYAEPIPRGDGDAGIAKMSGTILLIDDEESVRTVGRKMLERLGFEVLLAENGEEGLRLYSANRGSIRCVLLDLTMPRMDGEECYRELRNLDPAVCVIISSGYNEHEVTQKFIGKGLAGFIQKPYQLAALQAAFQKTLGGN